MERGSSASYVLVGIISGLISGLLVFGMFSYVELGQKSLEVVKQVEVVKQTGELEEEIIINAYNKVAPSVVHITSTVLTKNFFLEVVPQEGVGSGVIVSSDGYILTNNHVIENAKFIKVALPDGTEKDAALIGTDPSTDLAIIKIDAPPNLQVAALGDSDALRAGMRAIAIGNPFRLDRTITVGVISALNRTLKAGDGYIIVNVIQTDASINPGNSGGPLINSKGEVIGINTAIFSPIQGSVGIGFAIPINTAKKVMKQIIEKGSVSHPWLGISGKDLTEEISKALNLPVKEGCLVVSVVSGSPADKAGFRGGSREMVVGRMRIMAGGDVITSIDGRKVKEMADISQHLSTRSVGEVVEIGFIRDGEQKFVNITLGERPQR